MDLLSDILGLMKLSGILYFRTAFTAPWGVEVPSFEKVARFHYVHRGWCFAHVDGEPEALLLEQGDLIIIPHGASHVLSDPKEVEARTVDQVVEESGFTGQGALVVGEAGSGHESQLICGYFAFEAEASHVLVDALPRFIHIKDYGKVSPGWLDDTLKVIGAEAGGDQLGSDLIALKLSEIIFTQAIRHYLANDGKNRKGLAGFADPHICQSLQAIHQDPATPWTVESLAREAGLSRTAFANRFSELTSYTPLNHLTSWRMQLARQLLVESDLPIIDVAAQAGYQSEASFGRVFKRHIGQPPASYRRARSTVTAAS